MPGMQGNSNNSTFFILQHTCVIVHIILKCQFAIRYKKYYNIPKLLYITHMIQQYHNSI